MPLMISLGDEIFNKYPLAPAFKAPKIASSWSLIVSTRNRRRGMAAFSLAMDSVPEMPGKPKSTSTTSGAFDGICRQADSPSKKADKHDIPSAPLIISSSVVLRSSESSMMDTLISALSLMFFTIQRTLNFWGRSMVRSRYCNPVDFCANCNAYIIMDPKSLLTNLLKLFSCRFHPEIVRLIVILNLLLALSLQGNAQPPAALPVSLIGTAEGMAHLGNFFCFKDSRDYLWISSYSGLHQFDGKNMKIYRPILNDTTSIMGKEVVSFIVEDNNNNIWCGNEKALSCFVRQTGEFQNYTAQEGKIDEYRIQGIDGKGRIWVTFDGQIYVFDPAKKQFHSKARIVLNRSNGEAVLMTEFQRDEELSVSHTFSYGSYFGDPGIEIHRFVNDSLISQEIHFDSTDARVLVINDVYSLNDSILMISALEGVFQFNLQTEAISPIVIDPSGAAVGCTGIASFSDSTLLFCMISGEYVEYNYEKELIDERYFLVFGEKKVDEKPKCINVDIDGGIYIHLENTGLAYFHPKNLLFKHRRYLDPRGTGKDVDIGGCLIEVDNGKVIGTSKKAGILTFSSEGNLLDVTSVHGPAGKRIANHEFNSCLRDSRGQVWIFHYSRDLSKIDGFDTKNVTPYSLDSMFWKGLELPTGEILLMARKGLYVGDFDQPGSPIIKLLQSIDTSLEYTGLSMHANGLIIAGEFKKSIITIDPSKDFAVVSSVAFPYALNNLQPIPNSNDFLVPSFSGPFYYDAARDSVSLIDYCKCGISTDIYRFLPISDDRYFSSSENGVCTIDLNDKTSSHYGLEHGLGSLHFSRAGFFQHSEGTVWMGNDFGITTCNPNLLELPEFNNRVNISGVLINNDPISEAMLRDISIQNLDEVDELNLTYKFNTVSFQFAAFSYAGIDNHKYEHRMYGLEEDWVDCGDRGFARYSNLPAGKYTFESRVKDQPESLRAVILNIDPPLWGRLWFQVLSVSLTLLLLYYGFLFRERRKQEIQKLHFEKRIALEQERVRIATDMHDDVGSGLSALNMRAQVLAQNMEPGEMKSQMNLLARNSRALTQKIREIIWTVDAENDTLENLITRMHQHALEFFEHTEIECKIELIGCQIDLPIEGQYRREIYLTFKEILNNIYKHSKASKVFIRIETSAETRLNLWVQDDGIGFDVLKNRNNGNGLKSMRKRIGGIGGSFDVSSNSDGTMVCFYCPI